MSQSADRNAPVGVFDSGIGGLTVAREIMRQIPEERIVYFGDTARLPYGSKSKSTVIHFSEQIINFLHTKEVKAIVVACNTASALALETVQKECDVPIIGVIEPGAKMAARSTKNGKIGVIATASTVESKAYTKAVKGFRSDAQVFAKECPLLVPLVEEGWLKDPVTYEVIRRYLEPLLDIGVDTLIMGCTHYPLLRSAFREVAEDKINLVNPAYETAIELKRLLEEKGLAAGDEKIPDKEKYSFYVSDAAQKFRSFANSILPTVIDSAQLVDIEDF